MKDEVYRKRNNNSKKWKGGERERIKEVGGKEGKGRKERRRRRQ